MVGEHYWGLPWWNRKIVLLTMYAQAESPLHRGEDFFVEGNHWPGGIARLLPIFELRCTRTCPLKNAEIDLQVLREGPPRSGVRILGYTYQRNSPGWQTVPNARVFLRANSSQISATSDQRGIYDLDGLPPGTYFVDRTDADGRIVPGILCGWGMLHSGDIRECDVPVP